MLESIVQNYYKKQILALNMYTKDVERVVKTNRKLQIKYLKKKLKKNLTKTIVNTIKYNKVEHISIIIYSRHPTDDC